MKKLRRFLDGLYRRKTTIGLSEYARIPLQLMAARSYPFSDWESPEVTLSEGMYKFFNFYCWMYQLYLFYFATSQAIGNDAAVRVIEVQNYHQIEILGTHIFNIEEGLNRLHEIGHELVESPVCIEVDGALEEMSFEFGMAKSILYTDALTPFVFSEEEIGPDEIAKLGLCLLYSKQTALPYFEELLEGFEFEISSR